MCILDDTKLEFYEKLFVSTAETLCLMFMKISYFTQDLWSSGVEMDCSIPTRTVKNVLPQE